MAKIRICFSARPGNLVLPCDPPPPGLFEDSSPSDLLTKGRGATVVSLPAPIHSTEWAAPVLTRGGINDHQALDDYICIFRILLWKQ